MTTTTKPTTNDFTRYELGRVTRTWKGEVTGVIARCRECGRRGERSVSIPSPEDAPRGHRPAVRWLHSETAHVMRLPVMGAVRSIDATDSHSTEVTGENVDDLLSVRERVRYDAFVGALRERLAKYEVREATDGDAL